LEWIKFVATINDKTVKELPEGNPGGWSKQGRPRLRWLDDVGSDLMFTGVKILKTVTVDGTELASVVTDVKDEFKEL